MDVEAMLNIFAGRAEQAASGKKLHKEDDGLLHCDKCGEAVEAILPICGEMRKVFCTCRCDKERERAEKQALAEQERQRRIDFLRGECFGIGDVIQKQWTFQKSDGQNKDVEAAAHRFCNEFLRFKKNGKGLLLYGNTGTGKTFTAACIANELIDQGTSVKMTNFPTLINRLQESFDNRQRILDGLNRFDLLIIDDLAAERNTEYANEIVYTVIDSRYNTGLPLIVTTNIKPKDMTEAGSITRNRIYSRLLERCYAVEVKGEDRRIRAAISERDELKALLGV